MTTQQFVYAIAGAEDGRATTRLTNVYEPKQRQTPPRIAFIGAGADDPSAIAVHEYTNDVDGAVTYAPAGAHLPGWTCGSAAFHAWTDAGAGRHGVAPYALPSTGGTVYLVAPHDAMPAEHGGSHFHGATFYVGSVDKGRWMEETTAIHAKALRNICLPCAHDAATANLQDIKTDDNGEDIAGFMNALKSIGDDIAKTGIGIIIDIPLWLSNNLFGVLKGLGRAQSQSIAEQLDGGIRGFDLRVYYYEDNDTFYSYHGALGEEIETVLNELEAFLSSRPGEILYVTFTHSRHVDTQALKDRLTGMIQTKIGGYAYQRDGSNDTTLFDQTYNDIIGQGTAGSKAIIIYSEAVGTEFWPNSYSGQTKNSKIYGHYSNTTDIDEMISGQVSNYDDAVQNSYPFSLFMTLTPQESDVYARVAAAVAGPLAVAALPVAAIPFYGWGVLAAIEVLCAALAIYGAALSWQTLEDLTEKLSPDLATLVDDNFVPDSGPNVVSLVWCDFYEKSGVVDMAITLSQRS